MRKLPWVAGCVLSLSTAALAQEAITFRGLDADWYSAAGDTAVFLMHGTLAHNRMEIIQSIAEIVSADHDLPVLAPNLSYNLPGRTGMLDCDITHTHKHFDALTEISHWMDYLAEQGFTRIVVAAHSRGGSQLAAYLADAPHPAIVGAVLIAPATFDAERQAAGYQRRYGQELIGLYAQAQAMAPEAILTVPGFVYCQNAQVAASSFLDYYRDDMRRDTPTTLTQIDLPVTVIAGSLDDVVEVLPARLQSMQLSDNVSFELLDGADHFFRDLYADDVASLIVDRAGE